MTAQTHSIRSDGTDDVLAWVGGSGIALAQLFAIVPGLLPCLLLLLPLVVPLIVLGAVGGVLVGIPLGIWRLGARVVHAFA
jgi:hypothetical protein